MSILTDAEKTPLWTLIQEGKPLPAAYRGKRLGSGDDVRLQAPEGDDLATRGNSSEKTRRPGTDEHKRMSREVARAPGSLKEDTQSRRQSELSPDWGTFQSVDRQWSQMLCLWRSSHVSQVREVDYDIGSDSYQRRRGGV